MTKGNFYFLSNDYYTKYKAYGIMQTIETIGDETHKRPSFYTIPDDEYPDIYWMIPISSKIDKYKKIYNDKLDKHPDWNDYDGLEFGYVRGREAAFLLQNICPVTSTYIVEEYIDCMTNSPVSIPNDLKRKLNAKARKIIRLAKRGTKITLTDTMAILADLLK